MTHVNIRIVGKKVFTFIKHSFILFKVHLYQYCTNPFHEQGYNQ